MKKIWWNELIDTKRTTLFYIEVLCGILTAFVLGCRIWGFSSYRIYLLFTDLPLSLRNAAAFLYKLEISDSMRCFLLVESLLNIPLLFYAALLPAHIIGEEGENGTMAFICNGPFGRKEIFYGKLLTCCTNYAAVLASMFITCVIVTISGTGFWYSLLVCLRVFAVLLVMGLFLIHVAAFYCAIKNTYTHSSLNGVFSALLINTLMGYFYLFLMSIKDILEAKGKTVAVNKIIENIFYVLQRLSAVQICSPGDLYAGFPWLLLGVLVIFLIITGYLSGRIYDKKDFGMDVLRHKIKIF